MARSQSRAIEAAANPDRQHREESPSKRRPAFRLGETMTRESNVGRQWREAEQIIRQSGRPVPFDELHHQLVGRGVEVRGERSLRENLSRAPNLFFIRKRGYWLKIRGLINEEP
jgi:hypothetical protein